MDKDDSSIKEPVIPLESDKTEPTIEVKEPVETMTPKQSGIPGLLQTEVDKAKKKEETKKKRQERRKNKVENKASDTPLDSTGIADRDHLSQEFVFAEATIDDDEAFEDSVEDASELMTPKPYKSHFAKKVEAKLTPAPTPKRPASFADLSPIEPNDVKKSKAAKPSTLRKSSLPRAPGKN